MTDYAKKPCLFSRRRFNRGLILGFEVDWISTLLGSRKNICQRVLPGTWFTR